MNMKVLPAMRRRGGDIPVHVIVFRFQIDVPSAEEVYEELKDFIFWNAVKYESSKVSRDDLIGVASVTLMESVNRYHPTLGVPLTAFVMGRIKWAMQNERRRCQKFLSDVSYNMFEMEEAAVPKPLFYKPDMDEEAYDEKQRHVLIRKAISCIHGREREILSRHFFKGESLAQIGRSMGISAERTRQLKEQGLEKVRYFLQEEGIKDI
jgi:RNA polymerase sigma factor (sigma-70 family)